MGNFEEILQPPHTPTEKERISTHATTAKPEHQAAQSLEQKLH